MLFLTRNRTFNGVLDRLILGTFPVYDLSRNLTFQGPSNWSRFLCTTRTDRLNYFKGTRLKVNILSYDYCGYGQSSGKPNESNLNKACAAAYEKLLEKYSVRPDQVILYGQSIGTGFNFTFFSFLI